MASVIEFENVSKLYRLGLVSTRMLQEDFQRWWTINVLRKEDPYLKIGETNDRTSKGKSNYVWALKDINFKVEQGDVVGIIGKNGAGKSTLLKLLSKVTGPTTGQIRAKGRIGSLLEVGTGFHPEMTGRENIFLNGAILGMTKAEVTRKLDEIVDFSGCERYIDTPVKRYSSGMLVRLGFAVAAHLDPEILVVDEVLAVGDAEFQKKAIGKMKDVSRGEGRTVLFVSHNMAAVRNLCKTGIILKNGTVDFSGSADECVEHYISDFYERSETKKILAEANDLSCDKEVFFLSVEFEKDAVFQMQDDIPIIIKVMANKYVESCRINCTLFRSDDIPVGTVSSKYFFPIDKGEIKTVKLSLINHNFAIGKYSLCFSVGIGNYTTGQRDFDYAMHALKFEISNCQNFDDRLGVVQWEQSWGPTMIPHKVEIVK